MEARKTAAGRSAQDAIAMLKADHQRVRQLVEQYDKAAGAKTPDNDRKRRISERICQELEVHAQLEEELFYPAVRAAIKDGDLVDEAEVEHQSAKDLMRQIRAMSPGDALYDAKVKVLGEYVNHHVEEEEGEMFPKAKRAKLDVAELARRMMERKQQLEAERSMEPFDSIASMLMMPIRAVASAARAGAAAGRRAAATGTRAASGTARKAGATARKAGATTRRVAGATSRAATGTTRAATSGARAGAKAGARATGARKAAGTGARASAAGTKRAGAATGRKVAAKGRGEKATASAGSRGGAKAAAGARGGAKAAAGARKSRTTR